MKPNILPPPTPRACRWPGRGRMGTAGTAADTLGLELGVLGMVADIVEIPVPPGLDEVVAAVDVMLTVGASACQGETYYGQPHPDLPSMVVMGQDVYWNGVELMTGVVADSAGYLMGGPTEGGSVIVGEALDWVTSGLSAVYDASRLFQAIPTEGAIGFYTDDQGTHHIVMLDYSPAEDGGKMTHLGQSQLMQ